MIYIKKKIFITFKMPSVWNKYQKIKEIKEISSKLNIKTYLARMEPIIKEITTKDDDNYSMIINYFSKLKKNFKFMIL